MAYRKCEICGLRSERKDGKKRFFMARFPLDELRCKEWVKMAGNEDLVYVPIEKLHELKFICGKHFKDNDFNKKRTQLKKSAIPSINLSSMPLSDAILSAFPYYLFKEQQPLQEDEPSTSSVSAQVEISTFETNTYHKQSQDEPSTSTSTAQVQATTVDNQIVYEDDVPPVEYTVNIMTSEQDICMKDEPSTSSVRKRRKRTNKMSNENLSPRKKKLMKRVELLKSKIRKVQEKVKMFDNIQSKTLKTMMFSAIRNENRSSQGKRWSDNDKALAIAMYKKSPKLYRYLRHLLPLPSPRTLQNVLSKMPMNPGFNKSIIDHLKRKVKELSCKDKTCVILFDEMSLKKRLIFNTAYDKVEGFQDLGEHGRSGELADKALVFLLQGVHKKIKQPLAHYFVKGTISSDKLVAIIKNTIKMVLKSVLE
ncbi:uncharacterized protein LOC135118220 [Helicoverpa armigera]|uniref:uncharacterized protein LOC135118220 n=1 Tax=Helicoverpa armigera TaxID=29058 RepID=UPI00308334D8